MKNIAFLRSAGNLQLENNSPAEDLATQKATAKLRRDIHKIQKSWTMRKKQTTICNKD